MSTNETMKSPHGGGSALNDGLDTATAQIGISAGADFENNTWIFEMPEGFQAGAGKYMIIAVPNAELTSPPPVGFNNKPDYGGGSG